ncbi:MAG: hypothetical protein DSZ28_04140 [Thiothrix sp.]|nr:MAG: hypothetical protein DSZ28_04140 [Thiothrix sp.]
MWQAALTSNYVRSFVAGVMGEDLTVMQTTGKYGTDVAYDYDLRGVLLCSGDIEVNPGPVEHEEMERIVDRLGEKLMKRMESMEREMRAEVRRVRADINKVTEKLSNIERDIGALQNQISEQESAIDLLAHAQKTTAHSISEMEKQIEEREIRDRRDNVILHGVPESESVDHEDCERTFVESVNCVLHNPIQVEQLVRAHRIGKRSTGKPRPLIARVVRSAVKFSILQRREQLRERGIGVSGDLTPKQRKELQSARAEGLIAYFKGGVLHTETRAPRPNDDSGRGTQFPHSRAPAGAGHAR